MRQCSRVAARARGALYAGLAVGGLAAVGACTDPVFVPAANGDAGFEAGLPLPPPHTEPSDSGEALSATPDCEHMVCREEAGAALAPMPDAGVPDSSVSSSSDLAPDAGIDEVRMKWLGRYAARSTLFSFDDPLKSTAKLLSLVAIVPNESGGLTLEEELCFYQGGWSFLYTGQLTYTYVNARGSTPLQYSDERFESALMKVQIGYGPTPPECRAGATLMKREDQAWLPTTCDCPRNEDTPTSARDCRVTDQEGDHDPGATFPAAIDTQAIRYHAAQEERLQFLRGFRHNGRLHADRLFEDTTRVLDCTVNGVQTAAARCPQGVPKPCPSKYNKVELVELSGTYDCERVIAEEHALFVLPPVTFPDACPAELSGALQALVEP